ncbi:MAG: efflux RND transporter periplasmic adaptor subunit, partial [Cereibacter changlensis]
EAQARAAQLEAARAGLRAIEIEIANTDLRAPSRGLISEVMVEPGAYVSVGGEVLEVVDNDPLIAVANVQQSGVSQVRAGMPAEVRFIGGAQKKGMVRFVAPVADAATRTFRVEVDVPNDEDDLPAGLSAEITIPFATQPAHRVSAALGRLDDQGRLGLYIIDDQSQIQFAPIEVIRAQADGIWVTGLPERARIVTISQGSLADGQTVEVRETPQEYLGGVGTEAEVPAHAPDLAAEGRLPVPPDVPQEGVPGIPDPAAEER